MVLDEVTESSLGTQAKLLRVLETQRVRRVGALRERELDVRLVAASNRAMEEVVEEGTFRRDLFYRLKGAQLRIPPLRERPLEIPILARRFLAGACQRVGRDPVHLSEAALERLLLHDWPGNVRELKNMMEYLASVVHGATIEVDHLPEGLGRERAPWLAQAGGAEAPRTFRKLAEEIQELERRRIEEALQAADGVRVKAAELIGMPLRTMMTKMKAYDLMSIPSKRSRKGGA